MTEIGPTRDQSKAELRGYRLEVSQCCLKAFVLGIPSTFSNIKTVDEHSIADIRGIGLPIKTAIMHQHVKAVDTSRQECDASPCTGGDHEGSPVGGLNQRHRRGHSAPTRPPRVGGIEAVDQHRAGLALNSYPCLSV
jgi:hypothetical protein